MAEKSPPVPPDWHQLFKDLRKFLQQVYALLREKFKRLYTLLRETIKQWKLTGKASSIQDRMDNPTKNPNNYFDRIRQRLKEITMSRQVSEILSHWHKLFESFQESPQQIYSQLEQAIDKREIPDVKISRISYPEAGALSARREYLRIRRKEHIFDICAAPFGTGFFISWWLGKGPRLSRPLIILLIILLLPIIIVLMLIPILLIPIVPPIAVVVWLSRRVTYYRIDTALMFQDSVHSAVLEVIGQATEGKGIKALSELEKKPILSDLFKRKLK